MRKDKEKVLDEVWTEDHVKSFLQVRPHDGSDENFHMLLKAYQSMRASDFELFVGFFTADKRDINATGKDGRSVLEITVWRRVRAPASSSRSPPHRPICSISQPKQSSSDSRNSSASAARSACPRELCSQSSIGEDMCPKR